MKKRKRVSRDSWLVQKRTDKKDNKIGVEFLESFRHFQLKMFTSISRDESKTRSK